MLPRMIDIARAYVDGGVRGDYQIGRGLSGFIFRTLGVTAEQFVDVVARANDDSDVAQQLELTKRQRVVAKLNHQVGALRVADVPADLRKEFDAFYGDQPAERNVLDVLEENDRRSFAETDSSGA